MIIVDANLLIYAVNQDATDHRKSKGVDGSNHLRTGTVGLAWIVVPAFLRLITRAGLFEKPLTMTAAFELLAPLGAAGNLTSDAWLAALAIEHRAELCSTDNDFGRFSRLRWHNPLAQ
jgi:uncharacterized protein